MYCKKCRNILASGKFCIICGEKTVPNKFPCPHCKASNFVTAKFCEACGRPIQEDAHAFVDEHLNKGDAK